MSWTAPPHPAPAPRWPSLSVWCASSSAAAWSPCSAPARPSPAHAERLAKLPSDVMPGHAHASDLGVPGMSEAQLRSVETRMLGPEHAREHALMRRSLRADRRGAAKSAAQPSAEPKPRPPPMLRWTARPRTWGAWEPRSHEDQVPDRRDPRGAAAHREGHVLLVSDLPEPAQQRRGVPLEPGRRRPCRRTQVNPPDKANIWCAGQTFTADGELVVFGGNLDYESPSQTWKGLNKVFTFNPWTETWNEQPRDGTRPLVPDRRPPARRAIPIVSGLDESGRAQPDSSTPTNQDVELFTPPDAPQRAGTIKKIGSIGTGDDAGAAAKPIGYLYPRMAVMANGLTYLAGPDRDTTWYFDDVDASPTFTWGDFADHDPRPRLGHDRSAAVRPGRADQAARDRRHRVRAATRRRPPPSCSTSTTRRLAAPDGKDNLYGRGHANTVLLPDGSMVEVGGGRGSASTTSLPVAAPLRRARAAPSRAVGSRHRAVDASGPAQTEARAYHSTALLLPDGRVMSAGDDYNGDPGKMNPVDNDPMEDTAEIYKPPYLFRGARPTLSRSPRARRHDPARGSRPSASAAASASTPRTRTSRGAALAGPGGRDARRRHEPAHARARRQAGHRVRQRYGADRTATPRRPATTCCSCSTTRACRPSRSS